MNQYTFSALVAFILLSMGLIAGILGTVNYFENTKSKSGRQMCLVCWCVFFWNFGYAWMSMSYEGDFAYIARAIALLAVAFYMFFIIRYVSTVTKFTSKINMVILVAFCVISIVAWTQIIQKNAVEFMITPWGYWYVSKMSVARIAQFGSILGVLVQYYVILRYGNKHAHSKRELYVLKQFGWFGPILITGCLFDTFIPTIFKTAAVPGSSIAAFISSMLLFRISRQNKTFGLSVANVSEYVFKDVSIPVVITDNNGLIILFNRAATAYLNCDENDLKNQKVELFFEEVESEVYKVHNSECTCKLDKTDVNDRFGDLLYSIFFVQDTTKERVHLKMLDESREMAEKANKAKSEFLANMSHEIRTPLNAVLGIDEMILRESNDPNILDYAENIKQAGNMLLSLINDILDFSKIESGKMELNPVEFMSADLFRDISIIVSKRAESKDLKLILDVDPNLPSKVYGDDVRIRQILINILTNSIKYTQEGSITLKVKLLEKIDDEALIHVSIIDTGIGIKEEDLAKLFEAFQRVDVTRNRNIEGTGLGLSITNRLLDLMGTNLGVKSEYGKGSEFYFDIRHKIIDQTPMGNIDVAVPKVEERSEKKQARAVYPDASILIVDDNKVNLKVASGLLKRTLVKITTAMSGAESIELVKNNKYDIIMMDHMMPEMDGIEAVSIIKSMEDNMSKDAAIIALTANAVSGAKELFLDNGFDDFIAKPIKVDELEDKLAKYLT